MEALLPLTLWGVPLVVTIIVARQKGHPLLLWVPLAFIFSPLALCVIALLPLKGELSRRTRRAVQAFRETGEAEADNLTEFKQRNAG